MPTNSAAELASPWWEGSVIYELIPRCFADGNGDGIGDLDGLKQRLDYLHWLGVDAVWMTPICDSPLRDGGYDITDYKSVHPDLGDLQALDSLIRHAHALGLKVLFDLVLNHTSDMHLWFQRARWAERGSPERNFYVWRDDDKSYSEAPVLFRHFEDSNWHWDPVAGQYYLHRFLRHQPDLNYDNPQVQEAMLDVLDFWIDRGIDGFRLDAIPFLFEREGTRCEGLPETHAFLRRLRSRAKERCEQLGREEVLLLAEAIQPVHEAMPYVADDELHSAFNFALTAHLFAAVAHGEVSALQNFLLEFRQLNAGCRWALPLRNHDELWLGDGHLVPEAIVDRVREGFPNAKGHWLNWGINRRLSPLLNGDPRPNKALHALLYSLPGMPCIYYGDELGMGDYPGLRDRDANRTPMAWTSERNGGFSKAPDPLLVLPPITRPGYNCQMMNVAVQKSLQGSLLNWHRNTLLSRRLLPALRYGDFQLLENSHPGVISYIRQSEEMTILVAVNLSGNPASTRLNLGAWQGQQVREVLGGCPFPVASEHWFAYLSAYDYCWWLIGDVEPESTSSSDAIADSLAVSC